MNNDKQDEIIKLLKEIKDRLPMYTMPYNTPICIPQYPPYQQITSVCKICGRINCGEIHVTC